MAPHDIYMYVRYVKPLGQLLHAHGASEASGATLTGDVNGTSQYIYVCKVRQALGPITPCACVAGAESAIFEIYFYRERKLWGKKDFLLRSGLEPGSDVLQTIAVSVDYSGIATMAMPR